MKVVLVRMLPPEGPGCEPMDCNNRQGIEAEFEANVYMVDGF